MIWAANLADLETSTPRPVALTRTWAGRTCWVRRLDPGRPPASPTAGTAALLLRPLLAGIG